MANYLLVFLTLVHGAIHLMGFAKAFGHAEIRALTCEISRPAGALWLAAAAVFICAAAGAFFGWRYWWLVAVAGVLISQPLIFSCFAGAKFGTVPNVIILLAAVTAYGEWSLGRAALLELEALAASCGIAAAEITSQNADKLPPSIRKWLERSKLIGRSSSNAFRLTQKGSLRTEPEGAWMPVTATQWLFTGRPGFLWKARIQAAPLVHISGCDTYRDGRGRMQIKLMSLFTVADSAGKEIDQGTLLRYLGECVWAPAALACDYIRLEQLDGSSVRASMNYGGVEASGIYRFNADGDFASFEAKRYYDRKGGATLEDWLVTADPDGYREFSGVRVAAKLSVTWRLKTGDFTWYRLEIDSIEELRGAPEAVEIDWLR